MTFIQEINDLKAQVAGQAKELKGAHEEREDNLRSTKYWIGKYSALRDALEACKSEFEMMADPQMPSSRHFTPLEDMVTLIKDALATSSPASETEDEFKVKQHTKILGEDYENRVNTRPTNEPPKTETEEKP